MKTPIYTFIDEYNKKFPKRFHMPGHKGVNTVLGIERFDITEIEGADELYDANGIIAESERNASKLFGCPTFYSTEGSSHVIRAMLFLFVKWCKLKEKKPFILVARNAHKTFINTVALLDIDVEWMMGSASDSYEVCRVTPSSLKAVLDKMKTKPEALYITSPDYLGNVADIKSIADICHQNGILLLVDNAHGAYLRFLKPSLHPMDLGADICADSAHKTLPVLTGGAYLHISDKSDKIPDNVKSSALKYFVNNARYALQMFGSTSPSYLILASLDLANVYMETLANKIAVFLPEIERIKSRLIELGFELEGNESMKITIDVTDGQISGSDIANNLMKWNIYPEYIDEDHVVLMLTPENTEQELEQFLEAMETFSKDTGLSEVINNGTVRSDSECLAKSGDFCSRKPERIMSPHEAIWADYEELPASECAGRILAATEVSCPPAVPLYMMGERIGQEVIDDVNGVGRLLKGRTLKVVKEKKRDYY